MKRFRHHEGMWWFTRQSWAECGPSQTEVKKLNESIKLINSINTDRFNNTSFRRFLKRETRNNKRRVSLSYVHAVRDKMPLIDQNEIYMSYLLRKNTYCAIEVIEKKINDVRQNFLVKEYNKEQIAKMRRDIDKIKEYLNK